MICAKFLNQKICIFNNGFNKKYMQMFNPKGADPQKPKIYLMFRGSYKKGHYWALEPQENNQKMDIEPPQAQEQPLPNSQ
jgi:hypothetical protein